MAEVLPLAQSIRHQHAFSVSTLASISGLRGCWSGVSTGEWRAPLCGRTFPRAAELEEWGVALYLLEDRASTGNM